MKKLLTAIAAAVFVIYPYVCFASYVIHLKDGREFVTDRYWEEGDQIKFNRYGGVIGIQKEACLRDRIAGGGARGSKKGGGGQFRMLDFRFVTT
jgi:hypothetical protein